MRKMVFVLIMVAFAFTDMMAVQGMTVNPYIGVGIQRYSPTWVVAYLRLDVGAELRQEAWAISGEVSYLTGKGDNEWGDLINTSTHFSLEGKHYFNSFNLGIGFFWGNHKTDYEDYGAPEMKVSGFEIIGGIPLSEKTTLKARVGKEKMVGENVAHEKYIIYSISFHWHPFR